MIISGGSLENASFKLSSDLKLISNKKRKKEESGNELDELKMEMEELRKRKME